MTDDKKTPESTEPQAAQPSQVVLAPKKAELVTGGSVAPIIPRNLDELVRLAQLIIHSGLAPESYSKGVEPGKVNSRIAAAIMKGAEIGLAPMTALANIAIINGRACLWGDGAVALVQASGKVKNWIETYEGDSTKDDYTAICKIWRQGQEGPYEGRFSVGDARRARLLTKGPWVEYMSRMLMWRARSYAMRTGFADCLSGLSIAEEAQDLPVVPGPVDKGFLDDAPEKTTTEALPVPE